MAPRDVGHLLPDVNSIPAIVLHGETEPTLA
jgi:hypothetical protein